jgi:hypothetical protein
MQINRTGIWLLALFFFGGVAFLIVNFAVFATAAFLMIGVIWVLVSLGLLVYAIRSAQKAKHQEWVFKHGIRGRATIVSARSGALVNEQPVMSFVLDLDVPGQNPRQASHREIVSNFAAHRMQPGLVLPVYVNPQDPADFLLVW